MPRSDHSVNCLNKCSCGLRPNNGLHSYRLTTHQACRAQIGSISVTKQIAPRPLRAEQHPLPTYDGKQRKNKNNY